MLQCGRKWHRRRAYLLFQCRCQLDGKKRHPWTGSAITPVGIHVSFYAGPQNRHNRALTFAAWMSSTVANCSNEDECPPNRNHGQCTRSVHPPMRTGDRHSNRPPT